MSKPDRVKGTLFAGVGGFLVALTVAALTTKAHPAPPQAYYRPLPHHVPKYPGGLSFRFAMVHDVLTERYPRHGKAHYEARNELTRKKLAALAVNDPAAFPVTDDLAAGLARLGKLEESVKLLRDKLRWQQDALLSGKELYSTYANLGAILFHARMDAARTGDPVARTEFAEGVDLVRKAVEVNPEAHFGRERWQVCYAEFLRAAMDQPELLGTFDFVGNRLDVLQDRLNFNRSQRGLSAAVDHWSFRVRGHDGDVIASPDAGMHPDDRQNIRSRVTKVGAEAGWKDVPVPDLREPVPFDEPALGIVGMWRQGIGPDPHFALALGETMLRVGQRFLAWEAFERAARLADQVPADADTRTAFADHCRKRQKLIADSMPAAEAAGLAKQFGDELAGGERFQREYQDYESGKLAAGVPVDDPHFYDDFFRGRPPIASKSGPEEWFAVPNHSVAFDAKRAGRVRAVGWGVFGAGVAAMLTAAALTRFPRPTPPAILTEETRAS